MATTGTTARRRPLHTCGVSIQAIASNAYKKAQDFDGPIVSIIKRIAKLASSNPFVGLMQFQWLLPFLSFVDDQILAVENAVEALFPPSIYVFDKIDELVHVVECLPGKFDNAMNEFPVIIHRVPFLDWALVHAISWLNFLISLLITFGSDGPKEKEIVIDINCNESESIDKAEQPMESPIHNSEKTDKFSPTYKEMLEKGTKEDFEKKEDSANDEVEKADVHKEETEEKREEIEIKNNEGGVNREDPILELFESGWLMKPGRGSKASHLKPSLSFA